MQMGSSQRHVIYKTISLLIISVIKKIYICIITRPAIQINGLLNLRHTHFDLSFFEEQLYKVHAIQMLFLSLCGMNITVHAVAFLLGQCFH